MDQEIEKWRIALWLSPEDLKFLTNEWRKIPETVDPHISETWARIAFRSSAALHQAGIENANFSRTIKKIYSLVLPKNQFLRILKA